jgi:CPA2 family monovalent cation:H+ antiporter-2
MALAPLLIRHHDVLARFLSRTGGVIQPPQAEEVEIAAQTTRYRDHVIVCGAGELGLTVSEILRHAGVAHLLLEADAQKVEAAQPPARRCSMAMPVGPIPCWLPA